MEQPGRDRSIELHRDKDGQTNACARCGEKGITVGTLCYVRRQVIIVPHFQFDPEPRYIVDRERLEKDLAAADFKEGTLCGLCYAEQKLIRKGNKIDG